LSVCQESGEIKQGATDLIGHGTACISLIHRVAPKAEILPIRIFREEKHTSIPVLLQGLMCAVEEGVDLVNLSLGTTNPDGKSFLYKACEQARGEGTLVVSAMHHGDVDSYPAVFDNAISVGAILDFHHSLDYYFRPGKRMEGLAKAGEHDVPALDGGRKHVSGASYGAPNMTGLIALLFEAYGSMDLARVRDLLDRFALDEPAEPADSAGADGGDGRRAEF
jgi:subtilisin family serine protease